MSQRINKLRSPTELEIVFYKELLAPVRALIVARLNTKWRFEEFKLVTQRLRKEILRYGYVVTELGVMVQVESDILDVELDPAHRAMLMLDMQLLKRLTYKP